MWTEQEYKDWLADLEQRKENILRLEAENKRLEKVSKKAERIWLIVNGFALWYAIYRIIQLSI